MSIDNEERKKRCAEAMRAHGDAVYRLAFARCRNTADAEDIFQTTFLRFYASHIPFGNLEHEKASPEQRTVVHLHYFEGFSTGETAQMLGMRSATVRSHLHRARIAMRNALEDAGFSQANGRIGASVEAQKVSSPERRSSNTASDSFHESAHFNTDSLLEGGSNER